MGVEGVPQTLDAGVARPAERPRPVASTIWDRFVGGVLAGSLALVAILTALGLLGMVPPPTFLLGAPVTGEVLVNLSLLGPPVVTAAAVWRRARWWPPLLVSQACGAVSGSVAVVISPDRFGLAVAAVVVTAWAAAGLVAAGLCAIRRWNSGAVK